MSVALLVPKCTAIILSLSSPSKLLRRMVIVTSKVAPPALTGLKNFELIVFGYSILVEWLIL